MLTKNLKADTAYATCDGRYVVPQEPVTGKHWAHRPRREDGSYGADLVFEHETAPDPWGGCERATRPPALGVLVRVYDVDRHGRPLFGAPINLKGDVDRGTLAVLPAKDIIGTWGEYLTLHADKVRERADDKTWQHELNSLSVVVSAVIRQLLGDQAHAYLRETYRGVNRQRGVLNGLEINVHITDRLELDRFLDAFTTGLDVVDLSDVLRRVRELLPPPAKEDGS